MNVLDNINYDIELMLYLREDEKNTENEFLNSQIEQRELIVKDLENIITNNEFPLKDELEIVFKKLEIIGSEAERLKKDKEMLNDILHLSIHSKNIELDSLKIYRTRNFKIAKDTNRTTEIDLSNSSAVQKIIYLNELGIIDLLQKEPCFKASVNKLATVLSAITGENIKTLQPILNPMFNKNTAQKNNPYSSKLTVKKVKSQLINLGLQSK
jgi:hypothetical protein